MNVVIENIAVAGFTALTTWWFSRKKQNADVKITELDNVEKAIAIWRTMAEGLVAKFDDLSQKYDELSKEVEALRRENKSLKASLNKAIANYKPENETR